MKPVLANLRQGKLVHCWLGLDMDPERKRDETNGSVTTRRWVVVTTVYPNSPASAAGLQTGDKLISVNGRLVTRLNAIRAALLRGQPGDTLEMRIERKGAPLNVNVRLAARPDQPAPASSTGKR
jgi:S1-C subfamily serine protease